MELELKANLLLSIQEDYRCISCKSLPHPGFFPMYHSNNCKRTLQNGGYLDKETKGWCLMCSTCFKNNLLTHQHGLSWVVNTPSQKLFKGLPFQCKNAKYNCKEILMEQNLLEHELTCVYSKIPCAIQTCKADICYVNCMDHY